MNKYIEALEKGFFIRIEKENFEPAVFWITGGQILQGDNVIRDERVLWTASKEMGRFDRKYNEETVASLEKHFDNMVAEDFTLTVFNIYETH